MRLDLTVIARQRLGRGPGIDHYYRLLKEDDGELTLSIILRPDQRLPRRWIKNMIPILDFDIYPKGHPDHYYLNKERINEHNR